MKENSDTIHGIMAVNASAGSGKTHALAKRFVELFLHAEKNPPSFKNILAVTFTRRASKEMKQRIIRFFKEISFGTEEGEKILSLGGNSAIHSSVGPHLLSDDRVFHVVFGSCNKESICGFY